MDDDKAARRILVIMAHPDDVDYGAAGTVAQWTAAGHEVGYCVVTDGDAGSEDPDVDRAVLAATRRGEQRDAAAVVGVEDVSFLGHRDGSVEAGLGLRRDLARVIRQARPDLVLTHSPDRDLLHVKASHPDHRAVGSAVLDAVYPDARNPCAFPELLREEGLAAWAVPEVWVRGGPAVDHYVDVTATFDLKMTAIRAHRSQGGQSAEFEDTMRSRLAALGRDAGLPDGTLCEAYLRINTA